MREYFYKEKGTSIRKGYFEVNSEEVNQLKQKLPMIGTKIQISGVWNIGRKGLQFEREAISDR